MKNVFDWFKRRRAEALLNGLLAWREAFNTVIHICHRAFHEEATLQGDIGELLDHLDRQLFRFSTCTGDARRALFWRDRRLSNEIARLSRQIYVLRNLTVHFLIHAQGRVGPAKRFRSLAEDHDLQDLGLQGRALIRQLDADLLALWKDLQALLQAAQVSRSKEWRND